MKYGQLYYRPQDDGDTERDRLRDLALAVEAAAQAEVES